MIKSFRRCWLYIDCQRPVWGDARYKKDIRLLLILEGCMLAGIVIIAFKNWQVSAILLVNDLILDFIGIFGQYNTKKNK